MTRKGLFFTEMFCFYICPRVVLHVCSLCVEIHCKSDARLQAPPCFHLRFAPRLWVAQSAPLVPCTDRDGYSLDTVEHACRLQVFAR